MGTSGVVPHAAGLWRVETRDDLDTLQCTGLLVPQRSAGVPRLSNPALRQHPHHGEKEAEAQKGEKACLAPLRL